MRSRLASSCATGCDLGLRRKPAPPVWRAAHASRAPHPVTVPTHRSPCRRGDHQRQEVHCAWSDLRRWTSARPLVPSRHAWRAERRHTGPRRMTAAGPWFERASQPSCLPPDGHPLKPQLPAHHEMPGLREALQGAWGLLLVLFRSDLCLPVGLDLHSRRLLGRPGQEERLTMCHRVLPYNPWSSSRDHT